MPGNNIDKKAPSKQTGKRFVFKKGGFWRNKQTQKDQNARKASGYASDDVNATLQKVTQALSVLAERIQKLEGGPDKVSDRSKSDREKHAGPLTHTLSNNDDFASVVKDMYRMVQLDHHAGNWKELPKSLSERLLKFADDIRPPMPDEELRDQMTELTRAYGVRICETVRHHIANKRAQIAAAAATRDNTDIDRAKEVTGRQLARRLGRRLEDSKRQQLLDQAASAVGSNRRQPEIDADGFQTVVNPRKKPTVSPGIVSSPMKKRKFGSSTPPVSTFNHYSVLGDHADHDVEPDGDTAVGSHDNSINPIVISDEKEEALASFLTNAKTCVQVEMDTATAATAAAAPHKGVVIAVDVHKAPTAPTLASFLAKAKTCVQVEETTPTAAVTHHKDVTTVAEIHKATTAPARSRTVFGENSENTAALFTGYAYVGWCNCIHHI